VSNAAVGNETRLLIRNVTAVDPTGTATSVFHHRDILIEGARIGRIAASGQTGAEAAGRIIDGTGMLAMPGLINTHAHAAMVLFRGVAN
jgi:5-methylthioadenosine/S-adenosylhomocysteine deaminase